MKKNKKSKKIYILIGLISLLTLYLLFNGDGLIQYYRLSNEIEEIDVNISQTEIKIKEIEKEIDSLKNDPVKIENIARKKYHMKAKNEKLIKIREQ